MNSRNLKKKLLSFCLPCIAYVLKQTMTLLVKTCTVKLTGLEEFLQVTEKENSILFLWHNRLILTPFVLAKACPHTQFAALVSSHGDGQILSHIVRSFKNGKIIECHPKAGHLALLEALNSLTHGNMSLVITPDGPRGPYHEIKSGVATLALKTQVPVVPLHWEASNYFELNTWDKQRIPKPFSTIHITFGLPLHLDHNMTLNEAKQQLKVALLSAEGIHFEPE